MLKNLHAGYAAIITTIIATETGFIFSLPFSESDLQHLLVSYGICGAVLFIVMWLYFSRNQKRIRQ